LVTYVLVSQIEKKDNLLFCFLKSEIRDALTDEKNQHTLSYAISRLTHTYRSQTQMDTKMVR
jgi:hypothetical protein